jgi:hypothetical protein
VVVQWSRSLLVKVEGVPLNKHGGGLLYWRKSKGIRSTCDTRNTDPDHGAMKSLALCHPYLQQRCSVDTRHPACPRRIVDSAPRRGLKRGRERGSDGKQMSLEEAMISISEYARGEVITY